MNWIDLLGLAVLFVFFFIGVVKGLIREVLTLAGIILSFFLALHLMGFAASWVENWVVVPAKASLLVGFLILFFAFVVLFHIIGYILYRIVRASPLTILDRIAGGAFGLLKASLIIFILLLLVSIVPFRGAAAAQLKDSFLYNSVRRAAPIFRKYLRAAAPAFLRVLGQTKQKVKPRPPEPPPSKSPTEEGPSLSIDAVASWTSSTGLF